MPGAVSALPPPGAVPLGRPGLVVPQAVPTTLLPEPAALSTEGVQDAMGTLYAMMSKQSQNGLTAAESRLAGEKLVRDDHLKKELDALKREMAAEGEGSKGFFASIGHLVSDVVDDLAHLRIADAFSDAAGDAGDALGSPQFWKDLASGAMSVLKGAERLLASAAAFYVAGPAGVAYVNAEPDSPVAKACGVAGEAALTAVTLGAAAPVLVTSAIALSVGGYVVSETNCFGDEWSQRIALGMELAGAGCSVTGAACASASVAAKVDDAARALQTGGKMVSGAASVVEGTADVMVSHFEGVAKHAQADAKAERFHIEKFARAVELILDIAKEDKESQQRALGTLQGAMNIHNQTTMAAGAMAVRG